MLLNVINSLYLKQPILERNNLSKIGIAATAIFAGEFLKKYFPQNNFSSKYDKIDFVNMKYPRQK